jgi:hypothetical protein
MLQTLITALLLLTLLCACQTAPPKLQLNSGDAQTIGNKIWRNEGLGKVENLTVWNRGEEFPSLGIGHFIWYPAGVTGPFEESFPQLLQTLQQERPLPQWLHNSRHAPWNSRDAFYAEINTPRMNELRQLLKETIPQQTAFIIRRMEAALPKMLATLDNDQQRDHVRQQFYRVANTHNGLYALIDYINFKGEGTSPKERYKDQGWGLLQVLETMPGNGDAMSEFVHSADVVLTRRVQNANRDESRWLPGWRNRLRTYLHD